MADVKCLEHPTLKVPYELLNKKFRSGQKSIDREVSNVVARAGEVDKCLQQPGVTAAQVNDVINGLTDKLTLLKRKAEEGITEEIGASKACKRRIEHLRESDNASEQAQIQWKKKRLDRMLVDYFLRAGYYNTAIQLAEHSQIQDLTNIELFLVAKEVEDSLARHETNKCLAWCQDNKSKLRKMKSTLEFNLRQQEYIELIRSDKRLEAVSHARKYLTNSSIMDDSLMADVERVMGLLAFPADTNISPYKELLSESRWQHLIEQFRQENFKLYQLNPHSVFSVTLQAGMSALKTCYKDDPSARNADCPICSKHINCLARNLPFAHCANSRLICRISGQPLNEHNPPMMLPNGYVYGLNSLEAMAAENEGKVICPRTKTIFNLEDADKVFVM